jgi:hypothetical protein
VNTSAKRKYILPSRGSQPSSASSVDKTKITRELFVFYVVSNCGIDIMISENKEHAIMRYIPRRKSFFTIIATTALCLSNSRGVIQRDGYISNEILLRQTSLVNEELVEGSLDITYSSSYDSRVASSEPLPRYTLEDALKTTDMYTHLFALLIYEPEDDKFVALYSKLHSWGVRGRLVFFSLISHTPSNI